MYSVIVISAKNTFHFVDVQQLNQKYPSVSTKSRVTMLGLHYLMV